MNSTLEALRKAVMEEEDCGVSDDINQFHIDLVFEKAPPPAPPFPGKEPCVPIPDPQLEQIALGLFRGGEIPNLASGSELSATVMVSRVKHLKPAMVLTLLALNRHGFSGFVEGLCLIKELVTLRWDRVHPLPNPKDSKDPFVERLTCLVPLCIEDRWKHRVGAGAVREEDLWNLSEKILTCPLLESQDFHVTLRDLIACKTGCFGIGLPKREELPPGILRSSLKAGTPRAAEVKSTLERALGAVREIDKQFGVAPGSIRIQLSHLIRVLQAGIAGLQFLHESASEPIVSDLKPSQTLLTGGEPPLSSDREKSAEMASRDAALRKLDEVAAYFKRYEPSSPVVEFIERAKKLAGLSFLAILKELEVEDKGTAEFRKVMGVKEDANVAKAQK